MAVEPLRADLKAAGQALLKTLDSLGMKPEGTGWIHFPGFDDWRFYVASSLVDLNGKKAVYKALLDALGSMKDIDGLSVFDIHLESTSSPFFQLIGSAFKIGGSSDVTLTNCTINGVTIDAVLYRWDSQPVTGRKLKVAAREFEKNVRKIREKA